MTDENPSYFGQGKEFSSHDTVNHTAEEYVRGIVHVNFSESFFSLLKRGIIGTFPHMSAKHMQRYLEEFDFRWNRRKITDGERMLECVAGAEGTWLYFKAPKWLVKRGPESIDVLVKPDVKLKRTSRRNRRSSSSCLSGGRSDGRRSGEHRPGASKPGKRAPSAKKPREKPVSLHPLTFEEAVRGLLQVKPEPKKEPGEL